MRVEVGGSGKELRFDVDMGKTGSTSMAALAAGADPKAIMMGSYKLNNTNAADVENALKQHFGDKLALTGTKLVTDPGSNCIAVRVESNPELFKEITRIIEQLDANRPKPQPARGQGFPVLPGPIPLATPGLAVQENAASANLVAASKITVLKLSHANAADLATVLQKVFGSAVEITAEPRSNQLIIRAPEQTLVEVTKLLKQLDVSTPSGQGGPYSM
jgi:type II secretory pathway component GspD/PulD (secretin)